MKKIIVLLYIIFVLYCITLFNISCTTKYIKAPLNTPPTKYTPTKIITENDFLLEYRNSLIKIKEWEKWYNIQVGSNFLIFSID